MKPKKSDVSNTLTLIEFNKAIKTIGKRFDSIESRMVTKDDAKNSATKDDIKQIWETMAPKDDIIRLSNKLLEHDERFDKLENKVSTKEQMDLLLNRMDSFLQKQETIERKDTLHDH